MNILILTPVHPLNIVEIARELYSKYSEFNNVYSVQAMALLAEEVEKIHYTVGNYTFMSAIHNNTGLLYNTTDKNKNLIMFGNFNKETDIKFDHILSYSPLFLENDKNEFDLYLQKMEEVTKDLKEKTTSIKWYQPEDAEYNFPTLSHLFLFLKTLGIKRGVSNAV